MAFSGDLATLYALYLEGDRPVHDRLTELVRNHIGEATGRSVVVSLGDGTGEPGLRIADRMKECGVTVFSTDPSEGMSSQAKQRAEAEQLKPDVVKFLQLSAGSRADLQAHFSDGSVDAVVMSFSLMFVEERAVCMAEIARMLKPGGKAFICVLKEFSMIDAMSAALRKCVPDAYETNEKLRPAGCLRLKDDGAVEDLVRATGVLEVEASEIMKYPLYLSSDEQQALDMFCILLDDEGWKELSHHREDGRQFIRNELLQHMKENDSWIVGNAPKVTFQCPQYAPFIVTVVKACSESDAGCAETKRQRTAGPV